MNNDNFGFKNQTDDIAPEAPVIDIKKEKSVFSRLGFGLALYTLISFAVALIIQIVVLIVSRDFYDTMIFRNALSPVALYLFALPVLLLVICRIKGEAPIKRRMSVGEWLLILLISFGLMYMGAYMGNFVMDTLSSIVGYDYGNALDSLIDYDKLWITAIFVVIVAPIGEELVFRKLIIDRTKKYGAFVSIFFSALVFGLMHGNFYQFFYAFAVGLVFGYVYYNTGKIYLSIGLHAAVNFIGSILTAYLSRGLENSAIMTDVEMTNEEAAAAVLNSIGPLFAFFIFFSVVIAAMVCAILIPIVFRKKIKHSLKSSELGLTVKQTWPIVFANCGVIVMLVVYGLEFILNLIPA